MIDPGRVPGDPTNRGQTFSLQKNVKNISGHRSDPNGPGDTPPGVGSPAGPTHPRPGFTDLRKKTGRDPRTGSVAASDSRFTSRPVDMGRKTIPCDVRWVKISQGTEAWTRRTNSPEIVI